VLNNSIIPLVEDVREKLVVLIAPVAGGRLPATDTRVVDQRRSAILVAARSDQSSAISQIVLSRQNERYVPNSNLGSDSSNEWKK